MKKKYKFPKTAMISIWRDQAFITMKNDMDLILCVKNQHQILDELKCNMLMIRSEETYKSICWRRGHCRS